jgi:uncharacterized repeat protein (TIGR02543 family)
VITEPVYLYAIWAAVPAVTTYSVSYNSGTTDAVEGMPSGANLQAGSSYTVAGAVPTRQGYLFGGWAASTGGTLQAGASFTMPQTNVVLTATWEAEAVIAPVVEPEGQITPSIPATVVTPNPVSETVVLTQAQVAQIAVEQGIPVLDILGNQVPLFKPAGTTTWAFSNLIFTLLALLVLLIAGVYSLVNRSSEGRRFRPAFLVATTVVVAASVVLFILTQDIASPSVLFDTWTVAFVALLAASIVFARATFGRQQDTGAPTQPAGVAIS